MKGRVGAAQERLAGRTDTALGRLALLWFRRYFEASQNSGSAASLYTFLSVGPLLLAVTGLFHAAGSDTTAFAERLIDHNNLTGTTADLVRHTFGTAADNALAATVSAAIGFLVWGIGIGQIYQDVYARAWRITVRTLSDQVRFTIWFFVVSGLLVLFVLTAGELRKAGLAALIPAWLVASMAFWLWTPRYLLRGQIGLRPLLPGALMATIVIGGAIATSPLFLGPWLNSGGKHFGAFGVVSGLLAWEFILITISMVCAVFAPVWAEWRESERQASSG
jgi:membrane protein